MSAPEPVDLGVYRAAADAATPGPWFADQDCVLAGAIEASVAYTGGEPGPGAAMLNAAFIALARAAVPAMADEIERLRAELAAERAIVAAVHAVPRYRSSLGDGVVREMDLTVALATKPSPPHEETP